MARYVKFNTSDGDTVLVEVEESEVTPPAGVIKVGLLQKTEEAGIAAISMAQNTFEGAMEKILRPNAEAFVKSVRGISDPPTEVEITFALKITGELGNVAICKAGGEANYSVKLGWKRTASES
jgi:hypothetical protein